MKRVIKWIVILWVALTAGGCEAGWYAELSGSKETGTPVFSQKDGSEAENNWLLTGKGGYSVPVRRFKGKIFIELEHKSLVTDKDGNGGYNGVSFGVRWGD